MPIDALSVLCAQLTRDLFAIAKFLYLTPLKLYSYVLLVTTIPRFHLLVTLRAVGAGTVFDLVSLPVR